ncbi:hypothetical protein [Actinomadura chokoriensis]|uniref:Uncharacterized protein n=1 Tax=Actinomadura chokoriensis TaxID=454156 RepID=A0ABV4QR89_9ACTN
MSESPQLVTQLLKAVVAYTWFFETCDESILDDDTALKQQEYAGYLLNQLSETDEQRVVYGLASQAGMKQIRRIESSWRRSPSPWAWWSPLRAEAAGRPAPYPGQLATSLKRRGNPVGPTTQVGEHGGYGRSQARP